MFRGEIQAARETGERLMKLALKLRDPTLVMEAHRALGGAAVESGTLVDGIGHFDRVLAHYASDRQPSYVHFTGHDPRVISECARARALWALGYPDRAAQGVSRGLALAREMSHVQSIVSAAYYAAHIHLLRREPEHTLRQAQDAVVLAEEHGLELWATVARLHQAWALAAGGQVEEGIEGLRRELAVYQTTTARVWRPLFLGLLAAALAEAHHPEDALTTIEEALAVARTTGELYFEAELHRVKGELLLIRSAKDALRTAEACFREALEIARRQEARSWELRAATSLGRLLQTRGKRKEARALVTPVWEWFPEGRATADFKDAASLLNEL
jgi:predicted ATPase